MTDEQTARAIADELTYAAKWLYTSTEDSGYRWLMRRAADCRTIREPAPDRSQPINEGSGALPDQRQQEDTPPDEALVRAAERFIADRIATWEQNFDAGPGTVVGLPDAANAAARWHLSLTGQPSADAAALRRVRELLPRIEELAGFEEGGDRHDAASSVRTVLKHLCTALDGDR